MNFVVEVLQRSPISKKCIHDPGILKKAIGPTSRVHVETHEL
jgi:hypothetical protein